MLRQFLLALAAASALTGCTGAIHVVTVNPDGTFSPTWTYVEDGDTVLWMFTEPTDTIIPVDGTVPFPGLCSAYLPYDGSQPNEFTGPMPRAASGIYALGPVEDGLVAETTGDPAASCDVADAVAVAGGRHLCPTGNPRETMMETWESSAVTGVFIRLLWSDVHNGPGDFDWTIMDREIQRAVDHGKMYSLSFKAGVNGTPDWIFDPAVTGAGNEVTPIDFHDRANASASCFRLTLGSPAEANYRMHYEELLTEAARRIKARNAWYRALAYVKPSGANLKSHENRLPKNCLACSVCNPERWVVEGSYSPSALYDFYRSQAELLRREMPEKDMSYMLIHAGFPIVNDQGEWDDEDPATATTYPLPTGTEQTETILANGRTDWGKAWVVQHNGLGPKPVGCPNEGVHPIVTDPSFHYVGSGCPNKWVLQESEQGQVTGFQTNNASGVPDSVALESTLQNAWDNSDAVFLEIYEQRLWEAESSGGVLDPAASGRTLGEWAEELHDRRRTDPNLTALGDPLPLLHAHRFTRTLAGSGYESYYYVHGSKCGVLGFANYGGVSIRPPS